MRMLWEEESSRKMAYLGGLFDPGVEFRHQLSSGTDDQPQEKVCYGGWLVTARHCTIKIKKYF